MEMRGNVEIGDTTNILRFIVFVWKPNTTPVGTSVLLPGPTGSVDVWSTYSHDNRQLYTILYDRNFALQGNGTAFYGATTNSQIIFSNKMSLSLDQQFIGGTTVSTNCIWYLRLSDSSVLPNPTLTFSAKFLFTDS